MSDSKSLNSSSTQSVYNWHNPSWPALFSSYWFSWVSIFCNRVLWYVGHISDRTSVNNLKSLLIHWFHLYTRINGIAHHVEIVCPSICLREVRYRFDTSVTRFLDTVSAMFQILLLPKLRWFEIADGERPAPIDSPHKGPLMRKAFPFYGLISLHVNCFSS